MGLWGREREERGRHDGRGVVAQRGNRERGVLKGGVMKRGEHPFPPSKFPLTLRVAHGAVGKGKG